jgi:hypothetical protein
MPIPVGSAHVTYYSHPGLPIPVGSAHVTYSHPVLCHPMRVSTTIFAQSYPIGTHFLAHAHAHALMLMLVHMLLIML